MPNSARRRIHEEDPSVVDETLRLIGLFVVRFSSFEQHLSTSLSRLMRPDGGRGNRILWSMTGQMTAGQLWSVWLGATAEDRKITDAEARIRRELSRRVGGLLHVRNDIAHGAWHLSSSIGGELDGEAVSIMRYQPRLGRTKTGKAGTSVEDVLTTREELTLHAEEAKTLRVLVWEYHSGLIQLPSDHWWPGVTDRLGFDSSGTLIQLTPAPPAGERE